MSGCKGIEKDSDAIALVKELNSLLLVLSTAFFYREDLWFDLLRHANSFDDEWIQKLTEDELNFNEAVTLLCTFGLVDPDKSSQEQIGSRGYSVHSCVHSWIVFVLNKEWDKSLARLALTCIASEVPDANEKYWWLTQRRLLQHVARQASFINDAEVDMDRLYREFHKLGNLYSDQGKLAEAEVMYCRALEGKEKAFGPDHISTFDTVNNLGVLYSDQGKLAEAEVMYCRALEGKEKALGADHTSTLDTIHNIGVLYKKQGKLVEAEVMYSRALKGYEKAHGLELASSYLPALNTMLAFGNLLSQTDRKDMAKAMYIRALSGYTTVQGPSSEWSRETEDRLQALQIVSPKTNIGQNEFTKPGEANSRSLRQKIHKLRRWLKNK